LKAGGTVNRTADDALRYPSAHGSSSPFPPEIKVRSGEEKERSRHKEPQRVASPRYLRRNQVALLIGELLEFLFIE